MKKKKKTKVTAKTMNIKKRTLPSEIKNQSISNQSSKRRKTNKTINSKRQTELSIKQSTKVTLAYIYAAITVYTIRTTKTLDNTNRNELNFVRLLLKKYYEIFNENLIYNYELKYKLSSDFRKLAPTDDVHGAKCLDVLRKITQDYEYRKKIKYQTSYHMTIKDNIQLTNSDMRLAVHIFDCPYSKCTECNKNLSLTYGKSNKISQQSRKGKIAIAFTGNSPPEISMSYEKKCKKCNIIYTYGIQKNINTGTISRLPLKDRNWFEVTTETYILIKWLEDITYNIFHTATSLQQTVDTHNNKYKDSINRILEQANKLGKRSDIHLNYNRLTSSFYIYNLQRYLQTYCNKSLWLTQTDLDKINETVNHIKNIKIKSTPTINLSPQTSPIKQTSTQNSPIRKSPRLKTKYFNTNNNNNKSHNGVKEYEQNSNNNNNNNNLQKNIQSSNQTKNAYNQQNKRYQKNLSKNKKKQSQVKQKLSLSGLNEFKYLFNLHQDEIENGPIPGMDKVPVKNNKITDEYFIVYGDGNQKCTRWICSISRYIVKYMHLCELQGANSNIVLNEDMTIHKDAYLLQNIHDTLKNITDAVYKLKYDSYQCKHNTLKSTGNYQGYMTCLQHTDFLLDKINIKEENINQFIQWYTLNDNIDAHKYNVDNIKKWSDVSDDNKKQIETTGHKTITYNKYLLKKHFSKIDQQLIKQWTMIRTNILKILSSGITRSSLNRKSKNIANANINENNQMLLDTELQQTLQDNNFDDAMCHELLQYTSEEKQHFINFILDDVADRSKGCRKQENIKASTTAKSNGLNSIMNCAGFCIRLREEVYRETQTKSLIDIPDALLNNNEAIEYYNRITAIGYDFMCRMWYTLQKSIKHTNALGNKETKFWSGLMNRLFIDRFHIKTHLDSLCSQDKTKGIFHPDLPKFKIILRKDDGKKPINDQIVEQFWSAFNKWKNLRAMTNEVFNFFLILKREHHNLYMIDKLTKKGYTFIPYKDIKPLRSFHEIEVKQKDNKYYIDQNSILLPKLEFSESYIYTNDNISDINTNNTNTCISMFDNSLSLSLSQSTSESITSTQI